MIQFAYNQERIDQLETELKRKRSLQDWQINVIERLFDMANKYYTEETQEGALKIPDKQPEKRFIEEVFITCGHILGDFDDHYNTNIEGE
jgi:hypothetical protein